MQVGELIEAQDMNALLRVIDSLCERQSWDELLDLADMCEEAVERGKQLWPIAAHVDYRIALQAPADYAAGVLTSDATRFTLGPLTEVAASTHEWADLADHIEEPHIASFVAAERVLRGEDLTADVRADPSVLELPMKLLAFEPVYALATYRSDTVEVSEPWEPKQLMREIELSEFESLEEPELEAVLLELVMPWTTESNGVARAVVVEGDHVEAISALSFGKARIGEIEPQEALQRMAWAAASGGAHGRRRGAALGRALAWRATSALCDVGWPPDTEELAGIMRQLEWYRWDEGAPEHGWSLRLAVRDPQDGWAAAIAATDLLEEGDG
jgi:hypothetical protein